MSIYAIIREAGPDWHEGGMGAQSDLNAHAAFMNGLAAEGFIQFGGPLAGSEKGRIRVLLIADAASEAEIHRRLAADPWSVTPRLVIKSIEPWTLFLGAERLSRA